MVSLLEPNPREKGVPPAFANGVIRGVVLSLEDVAPVAAAADPELGKAVERIAKLFRAGIKADGVRQ